MREIFAVLDEMTVLHVPGLEDTVSRAIFYLMHDRMGSRMLLREVLELHAVVLSFPKRISLKCFDECVV